MKKRQTLSRQYCSTQVFELRKPFVKSHHLEIGCHSKGCQIGVGPYIGGKCLKLRELSQLFLNQIWFFSQANSVVRQQFVVDSPRLVHRYGFRRKRFEIRRQSQQSQLRDATKNDAARCGRLHPISCRSVTLMRSECQCQPEIHIGQEHANPVSMSRCPLLPESQRSARSSDRYFPVHLKGPKETQHVLEIWRNEQLETIARRPSPQPLRAASSGHQARQHHFEHVLRFSYLNSSQNTQQNQHPIEFYGCAL